jgi:flagellar biosynthesis chaperone FliJ
VLDASTRHAEAEVEVEGTAAKLRERTRQLRSAEKLVDRVTEHRNKLEAANEQRGNDDLASRRTRTSGGR